MRGEYGVREEGRAGRGRSEEGEAGRGREWREGGRG